MTKISLIINHIDEVHLPVDSIIVALKHNNVLNCLELTIDELESICSNIKKDIYVSMNKLYHDGELDQLQEDLVALNQCNIKGIFFDDTALYTLAKRNNIQIPLIWGNIHHATSYHTIQEWYNLGVTSAIVSPDITLNETIEIQKHTKSNLFVPLYGMFEIFSSNRFLLTNYLKYINQEKNGDIYYLNHKVLNTNYPIYEDQNGSHIINGKIMNGLEEFVTILENQIDTILIQTYMIDNIDEIIQSFQIVKKMFLEDKLDWIKISALSDRLSKEKGFLHEETVYKVGDLDGK